MVELLIDISPDMDALIQKIVFMEHLGFSDEEEFIRESIRRNIISYLGV